MFNFINNIGPTELIIIVIIFIIIFGARLAVGLGRTSGEIVKELKKIKNEFFKATEDDDRKGVAK